MSRILASNPELSRESIAATSATIEGMEIIQDVLWGATIFGFATAGLCVLVTGAAGFIAMFQRQPGVNIFGNGYGVGFALLTHPERFTEAGHRTRRIYIRAMQGFFASQLIILCTSPLDGRENFRFNPPLVFLPIVAGVLVLILGVLERLHRR